MASRKSSGRALSPVGSSSGRSVCLLALCWPVLIAVVLELGTLVVLVGFVLIVRWYLVPQVVVLDGKRGTDALRASWELTRGFAWRTAGLIILVQFLYQLAGGLIAEPVAAI